MRRIHIRTANQLTDSEKETSSRIRHTQVQITGDSAKKVARNISKDMRDTLDHEYINVDINVVWETAIADLSEFNDRIQDTLADL